MKKPPIALFVVQEVLLQIRAIPFVPLVSPALLLLNMGPRLVNSVLRGNIPMRVIYLAHPVMLGHFQLLQVRGAASSVQPTVSLQGELPRVPSAMMGLSQILAVNHVSWTATEAMVVREMEEMVVQEMEMEGDGGTGDGDGGDGDGGDGGMGDGGDGDGGDGNGGDGGDGGTVDGDGGDGDGGDGNGGDGGMGDGDGNGGDGGTGDGDGGDGGMGGGGDGGTGGGGGHDGGMTMDPHVQVEI
eukprot:Sro412_g137940.2  (242) ;mRNA; r:51313-52114